MEYKPTADYNLVYIYTIHDADHAGKLKVGKTSHSSRKSVKQLPPNCPELTAAAKARTDEQTRTAMIRHELLYTELALRYYPLEDGTTFQDIFDDKDIHKVLKNSGYRPEIFQESGKDSEWFTLDLNTVIRAIEAYKDCLTVIPRETNSADTPQVPVQKIVPREEQENAANKTISVFATQDTMLWDCKMRFGKTVAAYELMRRMELKRVIVVTHRPAVSDGWSKDHENIFAGTDHRYIDKSTQSRDSYDRKGDMDNDKLLADLAAQDIPFVYFASMQDLRGSQQVGGKYNKNKGVFDLAWELVIIDEAHEGTQTALGEAVIRQLRKSGTKVLSLTGTAYGLLSDYDENVFTWTYVDEQKAKAAWPELHPNEKNPYEDLPTMNILAFDLGNELEDSYRFVTKDSAFNFQEFFRTWSGDIAKDFYPIPQGKKIGDFVHHDAVCSFLNLITRQDENSNYPFSTPDYREKFKHTFWIVPGVKEARALCRLLEKHPVFKNYEVVNVAGDGDAEEPYEDALKKVRSAIKNYDKTITVSCGRLTTGVTVGEWTAVMMLSGSAVTAVNGYMQTIFRVQSPAVLDGRRKENCYVFDFAPDRALRVVGEVHRLSAKSGSGEEAQKAALGEFLNFCPVIAISGTEMKRYDVLDLMRQIKRLSVEKAIISGFDDDTIYLADAGRKRTAPDREILQQLINVVVPQKKEQRNKYVTLTQAGMTDEERRTAERAAKKKKERNPLTEAEKAALEKEKEERNAQKQLFDLLRAVSIRLPLLFYGASADITQLIHLKDFVDIVDNESWAEFMPRGLKKSLFLKISKYYDEDVLVGAGMRIRKLAKAADDLPPTVRARHIVELISHFKNPDKETVLTPWRVVNMHLGDTLGGYNFYDEQYAHEQEEPRFIEQAQVTADILLNPNARILEMNSKSGLYPLYMAYSLYMFRLSGKESEHSKEELQKLWGQVLSENIFVLCKTEMAKSITIRTLAGYTDLPVNALYLPRLLDRMDNKPRLARKLKNPKTWGKEGERMEFDAVVGNPPYQVMDTDIGRGASSLFPLFVSAGKSLNPSYLSMIMPARWYAGGKGLDDFRAEMLSDKHIVKLVDFETSKDCFPSADIAGGICFFLWTSSMTVENCEIVNRNNGTDSVMYRPMDEYEVFIRSNSAISILKKVLSLQEKTIENGVLSQKPFGFRTYERGDESKSEESVLLLHSEGLGYVNRSSVVKNADYIDKYKAIVGRFVPSNGELGVKPGEGYRVTTSVKLLPPGEICTETYIVIGTFDDELTATNFVRYYQTKFARFLLRLAVSSVNISKEMFRFVPIQDFSRPWTDAQLYEKYALTEEEIAFIEGMIKPME